MFGRYLLVQRISRGGMGEIFLAKHGLAGFEKLAVIKKVLPHLAADEQFISRFVDEAQVAIKLSHVNVAQVFEVGRVGDEYFLALEYVEGRDLRRTLAVLNHRKVRMPVDFALFIARELANGLAYAHRRTASDGSSLNLVHCDVSPPNVLVSFEGETKVIDFGIAKSAMRGTATDPKVGFGKFGYMAPEQLLRGGVVDHRTDLYAAGVVLFELLTGTRLYEPGPQPDYRELARKVTRGEHPLPSQIDGVLAPYDALVATALRARPEARYQTAAELRDAIQQCLVAVNPTISTDQLGAYMRNLFADEMAAQSELHARVASAHLSDFEDQLHTQLTSTVTFAASHPQDGRARRRQGTPPVGAKNRAMSPSAVVKYRAVAPGVAIKPSPAIDTMAPPTGAMEPVDDTASTAYDDRTGAAYDDSTGTAVRAIRRRRRQVRLIAAGLGFSLAAAALVVVFIASDNHARTARSSQLASAEGDAAKPAITVEPIAESEHGLFDPPAPRPPPAKHEPATAEPAKLEATTAEPASVEPASVEPAKHEPANVEPAKLAPARAEPAKLAPAKLQAKNAPVAAPPPNRRVVRESTRRATHKEPRSTPAPVAPYTREQLGQKYQQVRREYDAYKAKFGSRLEREWGELATFIQFMPASDDDAGRKEAARRLDSFRERMRE